MLPGSSLQAVSNIVACSDAVYVLQDYQRLLSTQPPRRLNTAKLAESSALKVGALTSHVACPPLPHTQHAGGLQRAQSQLSLRAKALCQKRARTLSCVPKIVELHVSMQKSQHLACCYTCSLGCSAPLTSPLHPL